MFKKVSTFVFFSILSTHHAVGAAASAAVSAPEVDPSRVALVATANVERLKAPLSSERLTLQSATVEDISQLEAAISRNISDAGYDAGEAKRSLYNLSCLRDDLQTSEYNPVIIFWPKIIRAKKVFSISGEAAPHTRNKRIAKDTILGYIDLDSGALVAPDDEPAHDTVSLTIKNIMVLPQYRNQGIAREALACALAEITRESSITLPYNPDMQCRKNLVTHSWFSIRDLPEESVIARELFTKLFGYGSRSRRMDRVGECFDFHASFEDIASNLARLRSPVHLTLEAQLKELRAEFIVELSQYNKDPISIGQMMVSDFGHVTPSTSSDVIARGIARHYKKYLARIEEARAKEIEAIEIAAMPSGFPAEIDEEAYAAASAYHAKRAREQAAAEAARVAAEEEARKAAERAAAEAKKDKAAAAATHIQALARGVKVRKDAPAREAAAQAARVEAVRAAAQAAREAAERAVAEEAAREAARVEAVRAAAEETAREAARVEAVRAAAEEAAARARDIADMPRGFSDEEDEEASAAASAYHAERARAQAATEAARVVAEAEATREAARVRAAAEARIGAFARVSELLRAGHIIASLWDSADFTQADYDAYSAYMRDDLGRDPTIALRHIQRAQAIRQSIHRWRDYAAADAARARNAAAANAGAGGAGEENPRDIDGGTGAS